MQRLFEASLEHPWRVIALTLLATGLLASGIPRLELRTAGEALTPEADPVVVRSQADALRFHDPRELLMLVSARRDDARLDRPSGFRFLATLQHDLERVGVLRPSGTLSLASLPRLSRTADGISVERYLDRVPDSPAAFARLLEELGARARTHGLLLSRDGRHALFVLPLSEAVATQVAIDSMQRFCFERGTADFELLLGGPLIAETELGAQVLRDLAVLVPVMMIAISVLLFLMLRNLGGVLIPLIETGVVLVWTLGAMGHWGAPIALVTTILPVVLMAMCITDEIHLLERLAGHWREPTPRARITAALADVWRPILLTSLTTATGFLSFTSASIAPLREFGLFAAFGILSAMLLSFSLIPALIVLLPERLFAPPRGGRGQGQSIEGLGRWMVRRPRLCFALGIGLLVLIAPGALRLRISDAWVDNFDPRSSLVRSERAINQVFWGSYRFDVVLEGPAGLFRSRVGTRLMQRVAGLARAAPEVGGVETYVTPLDEIARAIGEQAGAAGFSAAELADLFTLAEMSGSRSEFARLVSPDAAVARARLYMKSADYARAQSLEAYLDERLPALLAAGASQLGLRVHYSGDVPAASALVESIVGNQLRSIAWTLAIVAALLLVAGRNARALLALVPVMAATGGLFAAMGWLDVPLGIATSMFASLAVGVGVDFGIHFLHRFDAERQTGLPCAGALLATMQKTGRALLWNALVLAAGFSVLVGSALEPNHRLGLLLAGSTLACYVATLLFLPALLGLFDSLLPSGQAARKAI